MHILFVCKTLPHVYKGGIQTHTWQLSGHLIQRGHKVSILTSGSMRKGLRRYDMEGRELIELPFLPLRHLPIVSTLGDEYAFNSAAAKWIIHHQHEFDVLHLQGRSGTLVLKKKHLLKKPVITTLHGFKSNEYAHEKGAQSFAVRSHSRFTRLLEYLALKKSDKLIVVSDFLKKEAQAKSLGNHAPMCTIPNGIEIEAKPKGIDFSNKKLLFVGRLDRLKGLYQLLDAVAISKTRPKLDIIGNGIEIQGLKQKVTELSLRERVRFLGAKNQAEVKAAIDECYALILPSFLETQGIVLMEANVRCKPTLASDIPGIRSVINDTENGLLFEVGNVNDMAKKIDYLIDNESFAKQMGSYGRSLMEQRFSWNLIAETTEKLYFNAKNHSKHQIAKP